MEPEINVCVKMLLSCVHGGYMWLDRPVSIDIDLIVHITGLPSQGEDPHHYFLIRRMRKTLSESMKEKFHTFCGQRGLDVASICDLMVRFVMQALACKLLRKVQKRSSANNSDSDNRTMCRGCPDELGNIFVEPIFD
jgi:hypothetical protein